MQVRQPTPAAAILAAILVLSTAPAAMALEPGTWGHELEAGVCFDDAFDAEGNYDFSVAPAIVPCEGLHGDEVVAVVPYDEDAYPGEEALGSIGLELCAPEYEAFLGRPIEESAVLDFAVFPDEADWDAGMRAAYCIVYASEPVRGSAASGSLRLWGHTIAALGEVDGQRDILLVDGSDGSFEQLSAPGISELLGAPAWSPDGSAIAFAGQVGEEPADIYLVDVSGGDTEILVDGPGVDDGPAFSPDGTVLAYMSSVDDPDFDLYVMDLASGETTRLTERPDRDTTVHWSPHGTELAFRRRTDGISDIWVMGADGSNPRRLTDDGGNDFDPRWSPDGSRLLFTSDRAGNYDIWIMGADGSDPRPLTTHPADDEYPAWSPYGEFIVFHSTRHGGKTLWVMRADGSGQSALSGHAPLGYPAFQPLEDH